MKFPLIQRASRVTLLSALVFASPILSFAGGQSPIARTPSKSEAQDRTGITRAVQQGKGSGMTRNQGVKVNASRFETPAERQVAKDSGNTSSNWSDPAFRK